MKALIQLFKDWYGCAPLQVERLPKAGSNREYVRFYARSGSATTSYIGVIGPSRDENRCFIYLSRHFRSKVLPVPEILAVSADESRYFQTDLGSTSLYDALKRGREDGARYDARERSLIAATIRLLPRLQVTGAEGLDFDRCLPPVRFNAQAAMFDLNYFKYCFFRTTDMDYDELRLEGEMLRMAEDLSRLENAGFMYRDFQARNVMLLPGDAPCFIDFQGGRCGPLQYDVASYLWQASARYSDELREEMTGEYLRALAEVCRFDEEAFREKLLLFVLFRLMQVLGTYGLRGYFERKKYFIDSVPPAIENLRGVLRKGAARPYPYLESVLRAMTELPQFNAPGESHGEQSRSAYDGRGPLVVRVFSFSYKNGIPEDMSGNGGGYVFDCRGTHNPGRYERYRALTGLDEPVVRFLEDDGEILTFLDSACKLADAHVRRYMERGFTDLMFSFGCTGGRHRSVYCAQHLAEYINGKYGVEVRLCHREQGIERVLPARSRGAQG